MSKVNIFIFVSLILGFILSCNTKSSKKWENIEFEKAMNSYRKYVDTIGFKNNFDFILVKAKKNKDSTLFIIYLCGGGYTFLEYKDRVIDFFTYQGIDILLLGDFPNEIVNIDKNKALDIEDIVRKRYPSDYKKYLIDTHSVPPMICDFMNMTLTFKKNKLVNCKREYY